METSKGLWESNLEGQRYSETPRMQCRPSSPALPQGLALSIQLGLHITWSWAPPLPVPCSLQPLGGRVPLHPDERAQGSLPQPQQAGSFQEAFTLGTASTGVWTRTKHGFLLHGLCTGRPGQLGVQGPGSTVTFPLLVMTSTSGERSAMPFPRVVGGDGFHSSSCSILNSFVVSVCAWVCACMWVSMCVHVWYVCA